MEIEKLISEMIKYYSGDPKRIQHFLKVYSFASIIGKEEKLDKKTQEILQIASIVHDIGIKVSEEKYNSSAGKYQEIEGPSIARDMLFRLGYDEDIIARVCYLVGHHHTYNDIQGVDYQILVEADFLVNIYEDGLDKESIINAYDRIFKTVAGKTILKDMYGI